MKKYLIIIDDSLDNRYFVRRNTLEEAKAVAKAYAKDHRNVEIIPYNIDDVIEL